MIFTYSFMRWERNPDLYRHNSEFPTFKANIKTNKPLTKRELKEKVKELIKDYDLKSGYWRVIEFRKGRRGLRVIRLGYVWAL